MTCLNYNIGYIPQSTRGVYRENFLSYQTHRKTTRFVDGRVDPLPQEEGFWSDDKIWEDPELWGVYQP